MSGPPPPSAVSSIWPRNTGSTTTAPSITGLPPLDNNASFGLPTVTNLNLPSTTISNINNIPPYTPQAPLPPFGSFRQPPLGPSNSLISNNYATVNTLPSSNLFPNNFVRNPVQVNQNEGNHRRLMQLEDENARRQNLRLNIQQMGTQLLQGQTDEQEQVLQYQFMIQQCMENLDHQNFVLNEQADDLAVLRSKMEHFDYLFDALKLSKEGNQLLRNTPKDSHSIDSNRICFRKPLSLSTGGVTRITSSKFQPFNPPYRPPNNRSMTPAIPNPSTTPGRLSRPTGNLNN